MQQAFRFLTVFWIATITFSVTFGQLPPASIFNSGSNGMGGVIAGGANDLNWEVAYSMNGPYLPAIKMSSIPAVFYNSPWPDAAWISFSASGYHVGDVDLYFKNEFILPASLPCYGSITQDSSFCLSLDYFVDNSVYEIYVNGQPQSSTIPSIPVANPYYYLGYQQSGMLSATLCSGWQAGLNTLIIHIKSAQHIVGFLVQNAINPPPPAIPITDTSHITICNRESYIFANQSLSNPGTYSHLYQTALGCDSLAVLILSVTDFLELTTADTICEGQSVDFRGQQLSSTGLYTDTVFSTTDCDSLFTYALMVFESPALEVNANGPLCTGEQLQLTASTNGTIQSIEWFGPLGFQSNQQNPSLQLLSSAQSGWYHAHGLSSHCASITDSIYVQVHENVADFSIVGKQKFCIDGDLDLHVPAQEGVTFVWYLPNGDSVLGPELKIKKLTTSNNGQYRLRAFNEHCGTFADTAEVEVLAKEFIFPTAFSPNNDGLNDVFLPVTEYNGPVNFIIYDRWGNQVFQSPSSTMGWDGTFNGAPAAQGMYSYVLFYEGCSTTSYISGSVTLLR